MFIKNLDTTYLHNHIVYDKLLFLFDKKSSSEKFNIKIKLLKGADQKVLKFNKVHTRTHRYSDLLISNKLLREVIRQNQFHRNRDF